MKRLAGRQILLALALIVWSIGCPHTVYASGNPSVILESAGADMETRTIQVACNMKNMNGVTNGKVRISYEEDKLRLMENRLGDSFHEGMCEVNDCLTGNKAEGEIVMAFASAGELSAKGCLADMDFALSDNVKAGEEVHLTVEVEKMAGNKGDKKVEKKDLTVKIPDSSENVPGNSEGDGNHGSDGNGKEEPGNNGSNQQVSGGTRGEISGNGDASADSGRSERKSRIGSSGSSRARAKSDEASGNSSTKRKIGSSGNEAGTIGEDEGVSAKSDSQLKTSPDNQIPLAMFGEGHPYWWLLPLAVITAIVIFVVIKKKRKDTGV